MGFDAGSAFSEAFDRVTTQVAVVLIGVYAAVSIVQAAAIQDIVREVIEELREIVREESDPQEYRDFVDATDPLLNELPLALGLDLVPAIFLLLVATIASTAVIALAIDAFARRMTTVDELDASGLLHHTLNIFVGGIAYGLLVAIGAAFFLLPGLVAFVLFAFFPIAVVVEHQNFLSAFRSSLDTVTDNLGHTLLVLLLSFVIGVAGSVLSTIATAIDSGTIGGVLSTTVTGAGTVVILALLTRAYVAANPDADGADADEPAADAL